MVRFLAILVGFALFVAAPVAADETIARGSFTGASGHKTSGHVSVMKGDGGVTVVLEKDFSFDGAPDPKLGFGKNGYDKTSQFSELRDNKGAQTYELPASVDPMQYNEIWVWCEQFAVPLGVAKFE